VLERAGEEGPVIFGHSSIPPTVDRWQWDPKRGRPRLPSG
jgi:hypothetical protein